MIQSRSLLLAGSLALAARASATQQQPVRAPEEFERSDATGKLRVRVRESLIGFNDPAMLPKTFVWAAKGERVAYGVMEGGSISIVVDGVKGEPFEGLVEGSLKFSPDGKHLTYVGTRPTGNFLVLDGKSYAYAGVSTQGVVFSEQGDRIGWVASRDGSQFAVIDGVESPPYSGVAPPGIQFTPDGKHSAYVATTGDKSLVVLDGQDGMLFDAVSGLRFSSGGSLALYFGTRGEKSYAVVNADAYGPYDRIRSVSRDPGEESPGAEIFELPASGTRFGFTASRGEEWFIVIDGKEHGPFSACAGLSFSADGSRVVYIATRGDGWFISVDGAEEPARSVKSLSLSPDGKRLGSVVRQGDKLLARIDGVEGQPYERIEESGIHFSPDGKHFAYVASEGSESFVVSDGVEGPRFKNRRRVPLAYHSQASRLVYSFSRGEREILVIDGVEGPALKSFQSLAFSPSGSRSAYAGELEEGRWIVVIDGEQYGTKGRLTPEDLHNLDEHAFRSLGRLTPIFSPDAKHVAWTGLTQQGWFVAIDDWRSLPYAVVMQSTLSFSPDGRHFVYAAERAGKRLVVIDGLEIENGWDGFLLKSIIRWEDAQRFSIRGTRDPQHLLIGFEIL